MSLLKENGINFNISAPGRIVFCGDMGMICETPVVLASLNLRTSLDFSELPVDEGKIIIEFPKVGLMNLEVSMEVIHNFRFSEHFTTHISDHLRFRNILKAFVFTNRMWITHHQRKSLLIFFFLLMHIATYEELNIKPFRMYVTTELPIGCGLGSSSSFALCLSACFLYWTRLQKGADNELNLEELSSILKYAKLAEKVVRTEVSETDIDVCCGKIIKFQCEQYKYSIEKIDALMMNIMLVDLKNESKVGDRMRQIAEKCFNRFLDLRQFSNSFYYLSIKICQVLENINIFFNDGFQHAVNGEFSELKKYFEDYRRVLIGFGSFEQRLDRMCTIANSVGNCVGMIGSYENNPAYILLLPTITLDQIMQLRSRLWKENFGIYETNVNCAGLKIKNM